MIQLVKEIVKDLLEQSKKTVAVYGGGFKPPTKGHFEVVKQALDENPEIDEFLIYVGKKDRDGVTQEDAMKIWGIYRNYLPYKVKIRQSTQAPIKEIYDYAKEHPDEEVLWVIGAREENEADFADIASRTKSITKYPNLELRTIVTKGGVSGTAARNASKVSPQKLNQYLPDFLSSQEKNNIYVILSNEISEKQTLNEGPQFGILYHFTQDLSQVISSNTLRGPVSLTRSLDSHVSDWLGDQPLLVLDKDKLRTKYKIRPYKDTTQDPDFEDIEQYDEMEEVIDRDITNLDQYLVKVVLPYPDEIWEEYLKEKNIPYEYKKSAIKERNRKEIYKHRHLKYSLNENATYSQHIDVKQKIKELTKHMLDKGMNIKPLPKVIFKNGNAENAKQFLGKTAYYDPDNKEIVLYTEGRHPKDIVRSFSHEMIHHIQNLENRLGNITTTNTMEDDHLDKLEQEANLGGTMTFRNWTDSIKEGKKKDPFGLNAFAHELARLREEDGEYQIYLDMDGVVADFDQRFRDLSGMAPSEFEAKYGKDLFWDFIDEGDNKVRFWVGIPPMEGAKQLVDYVSKHNYVMLTAPSIKKQSRLGKNLWIRNHTGDIFPSKPKVIFKAAKEKHLVKPSLTEKDILIDDKASTIDNWNAAGGTGILYQSAPQVISTLKKIGL